MGRTSWREDSRLRCSSLDWPRVSTTPGSSSARDISASENRLLIFPPLLFVLTHKNTSTSVSSLPSEVAVPAVSRGRMQRRERLDLTREKILTKCDVSKIIYLKNK